LNPPDGTKKIVDRAGADTSQELQPGDTIEFNTGNGKQCVNLQGPESNTVQQMFEGSAWWCGAYVARNPGWRWIWQLQK